MFPVPVTQDGIDDAIAALGLVLTNILPRAPGRPRQIVTASRDGRASVVFAKDERLDVTYAIVGGDGAPSLAERLAAVLGRVELGSLASAADLTWALRHAAVLQRPVETESIVLRGLASEDPRVRAVAALVTAYAPTPTLVAALEAALASERDGDALATMRAASSAIRGPG